MSYRPWGGKELGHNGAHACAHTHTQTRKALFSSSERASSEDPNVSLGPFISDNFEAGQNP